MALTQRQATQGISWTLLKRKASLLGKPAWKLAEEYAFHVSSDSLNIDQESLYANGLNLN